MSGLREKLADKFQQWQCSQCDLPRSEWLALADECLRQMEWAFQRGQARGIQDERGTVAHGSMRKTTLTAAPDDWTPDV